MLKIQTLSRLLFGLFGFSFLSLGSLCFTQPEMTASLLGYDFLNESGLSEFITVYGGFYMGIGLCIGLGAILVSFQKPICLFVAITSTLSAFARIYSFVLLSPSSSLVYQAAIVEIGVSIIAWVGVYLLQRQESLES